MKTKILKLFLLKPVAIFFQTETILNRTLSYTTVHVSDVAAIFNPFAFDNFR